MWLKRRFLKRKALYLLVVSAFAISVILVRGKKRELQHRSRPGRQFAAVNSKQLQLKNDYDARYVVFNRVPKCGSMTMTTMCYRLGAEHGFKVASPYEEGETPHKSAADQKEFVRFLQEQENPYLYIRHQYFIDFEKFGLKQPIYVNMIRDPIARFESFYYFSRFGNQRGGGGARLGDERTQESIDECVQKKRHECKNPYWQMVPYFCGQESGCMSRSRWALERAKENIEKHYVFVGTLEHLDDSLKILGRLLPNFFKDADKYIKSEESLKIRNETYTRNKKPTSESAKQFLRTQTSLSLEYELYKFVQERLFLFKDMLLY